VNNVNTVNMLNDVMLFIRYLLSDSVSSMFTWFITFTVFTKKGKVFGQELLTIFISRSTISKVWAPFERFWMGKIEQSLMVRNPL